MIRQEEETVHQPHAEARPTPPALHAFEFDGSGYVYDITTGSIFGVPVEDVGALNELARSGSNRDSKGEPEPVAAELDALETLGFFRKEDLSKRRTPQQARDALLRHQSRKTQALVQTSCNLKCTYCYEVASGFHSTGKKMDNATGKAIVDLAFSRTGARNLVEINFFGGEPLLNFDLVESMVAYAEELAEDSGKLLGFTMTTNGTLMTNEIADFLVEKQFGVMVSIDGPPEIGDRNRVDHAGKGTTQRAIDGALLLRGKQLKAGVREITVRATLSRDSNQRDEVSEYLRGLGFERVMIGADAPRVGVDGWPSASCDNGTSSRGVREVVRDILAVEGRSRRRALLTEEALDGTLRHVRRRLSEGEDGPSISCGVGRNTLAITESGDMYPCHRYVGEDAYKIGELETGIDRERLTKYYDTLLEGYESHCRGCWARVVCGGQCAWHRSDVDGTIHAPSDEYCDGIRSSMEGVLALHAELISNEERKSEDN